jgi:cytoskeleton protein RodZ
VILVGAVLALIAYIGWYQWSGSGDRTVDAVAPVPPRIEQAARLEPPAPAPGLAAPPPASSPTTAQAAPVPPPVPVAPPPAPVPAAAPEGRILLRARADSWIQLRDRGTGTVILNRVLRAGETYAVPPREGLLFSTGNAGGLDILVDGQPVPALGGAQPVRRDLLLEPDRLKSGQPPQAATTTATPRPAQ